VGGGGGGPFGRCRVTRPIHGVGLPGYRLGSLLEIEFQFGRQARASVAALARAQRPAVLLVTGERPELRRRSRVRTGDWSAFRATGRRLAPIVDDSFRKGRGAGRPGGHRPQPAGADPGPVAASVPPHRARTPRHHLRPGPWHRDTGPGPLAGRPARGGAQRAAVRPDRRAPAYAATGRAHRTAGPGAAGPVRQHADRAAGLEQIPTTRPAAVPGQPVRAAGEHRPARPGQPAPRR
jgi:hypothetical protein